MADTDEFAELMAHLQDRDAGAASEVYAAYRPRLIGLARKRLGTMARHASPESVVNSAFKSFFRRVEHGGYSFDDPDDLGNLLAEITVCKCLNKIKYVKRGKRDPDREVPLGSSGGEPAGGSLPEETALLEEALGRLTSKFSESKRPILRMLLKGYKPREIAEGRFLDGSDIPAEDRLAEADRVSEATALRVKNRAAEYLRAMIAETVA